MTALGVRIGDDVLLRADADGDRRLAPLDLDLGIRFLLARGGREQPTGVRIGLWGDGLRRGGAAAAAAQKTPPARIAPPAIGSTRARGTSG